MDSIITRTSEETVPDQWESQVLARILLGHEVIMVTNAPRDMVEAMHMRWAQSLEEAMEIARGLVKKADYSVTVIPDGGVGMVSLKISREAAVFMLYISAVFLGRTSKSNDAIHSSLVCIDLVTSKCANHIQHVRRN